MTIPALPPSITYGKVVGRFLLAVADSPEDADRKPDSKAAQGTITFSPVQTNVVVDTPESALIVKMPIRCGLDTNGRLVDPEGQLGVWLIAGVYKVTYAITGVAINGHNILVLEEHDDDTPLQLNNSIYTGGAPLVPSEYATLSARIDALGVPGSGGSSAVESVNGEQGVVVLDATDVGAATTGDVSAAIEAHESDVNPHPQYLTEAEGDGRYSASGAVAAHESAGDPHPQYLTQGEGDGRYAPSGLVGGVSSVNGKTGGVTLTPADVGAIPAGDITLIDVLTQAAYDALTPKVATTLYIIQG